ncbi:MAG TPA: hypothetical protein VH349_05245 [Ktedonobacterales bacterium]
MQAETRPVSPIPGAGELDPAARRLTALDAAFLALLGLMLVGHIAAALLARGWITAALIDALALIYLVVLLARPVWRSLVGRLMLLGLVAGVLELFTDAAGHQFARSLFYPQDQPMLWDSPFYMPLSWMIVLTQLGYLAWRLAGLMPGGRLPWRAILLMGLVGAINVPFYEEAAYHAGWWRYAPTILHLGNTPAYVLLFEGLVAAVLPLLTLGLLKLRWRSVALRGVILGLWMPCAALLAWLLLGVW